MKKLIIAACAALLASATAHAQFGVVAGVTSTSTNLKEAYDDIAKTQSVTQYHAGVVYKLNLPFGIFVQPGVQYNMKGQTLSSQILTEKVDINTKTGYLEVPVELGLQCNFGPVAAFAFVEPYAGFAVTTETVAKAQDATKQAIFEAAASAAGVKVNTAPDDADKWDGRERLTYGISIGGGVLIFKHIGVSAKYVWDMGKLFNDEGQASLSAKAMSEAIKDQKCSGIMATVSLYF